MNSTGEGPFDYAQGRFRVHGLGRPPHEQCRFLSPQLRLSRNDKGQGFVAALQWLTLCFSPIAPYFAIRHVLRKMAMDTPSLRGFLLLCLSLLMFWELVCVLKRKFARKSVTKVTWRSPRLFITCTY
jgi:predicted permease